MPVTPDRFPGTRVEEEIQFEDRTADGDPTVAGAVRYTDGALKGVDALGVFDLRSGLGAHAGTHISGQSDEIDGDKLDIDFTPTNYTPDDSIPEADSVDDLSAHLKGIDTALASSGSLPTPTEIGQLLFSVDGVSFYVTSPLTSPDGWMANDLGDLMYTDYGSAAAGLPSPTEIGQILFSQDGLTFAVTSPLTSPDGWLANDLGDMLYV